MFATGFWPSQVAGIRPKSFLEIEIARSVFNRPITWAGGLFPEPAIPARKIGKLRVTRQNPSPQNTESAGCFFAKIAPSLSCLSCRARRFRSHVLTAPKGDSRPRVPSSCACGAAGTPWRVFERPPGAANDADDRRFDGTNKHFDSFQRPAGPSASAVLGHAHQRRAYAEYGCQIDHRDAYGGRALQQLVADHALNGRVKRIAVAHGLACGTFREVLTPCPQICVGWKSPHPHYRQPVQARLPLGHPQYIFHRAYRGVVEGTAANHDDT